MRTRGYLVSDAVKRFGASPHLLVRASASASLADPRDLQLPENAAYSAFNFTSDNSVSHLLSRSQLQASCLGTPRTILVSNHLAVAVPGQPAPLCFGKCVFGLPRSLVQFRLPAYGSRPAHEAFTPRRSRLYVRPGRLICRNWRYRRALGAKLPSRFARASKRNSLARAKAGRGMRRTLALVLGVIGTGALAGSLPVPGARTPANQAVLEPIWA